MKEYRSDWQHESELMVGVSSRARAKAPRQHFPDMRWPASPRAVISHCITPATVSECSFPRSGMPKLCMVSAPDPLDRHNLHRIFSLACRNWRTTRIARYVGFSAYEATTSLGKSAIPLSISHHLVSIVSDSSCLPGEYIRPSAKFAYTGQLLKCNFWIMVFSMLFAVPVPIVLVLLSKVRN
jgi:hypothetical protein